MVPQVEQFIELKTLLANRIQANVDLQPLSALLELGESCLALSANSHDAAGHRDHRPLSIQRFGRNLSELLPHFGKRVRCDELVGVCLLAKRGNLAQLVLAERKEIALEF